jgi:hypothetical protein
VFAVKRRAMEALVAQQHMWDYWRGQRPRTRARAAFRDGELGLDRYNLRQRIADLGVEYVDYRSYREAP